MYRRAKPALAIAMLIVSLGATRLLAEDIHSGKVASVSKTQLMIINQNGETESFTVPDSCKIKRNGKEAQLDELAVGDAVKVESERNGDTLTAKSIEAVAAE